MAIPEIIGTPESGDSGKSGRVRPRKRVRARTGRGKADSTRTAAGEPTQALAILQEPPNGKALVPKNQPFQIKGPIHAICQSIKGGRDTFISFARLAVQIEPKLSRFVEEWDRLEPKLQKLCNLDQLCEQKEIDAAHLISVSAEAAVRFRDNACLMIAAINMPAVIERSIKTALTKDGVKDRKMLMEHSGFVPVPRGTTIINKNETSSSATVNDADHSLPSFERTITMIEEEDA